MSDSESDQEVSQPIPIAPTKKPRKPITEKQRQARIKNLAAGREKRLANVQAKKKPIQEYDIDSDDSSDDDEFVLSKKKKGGSKPTAPKEPKGDLKGELQELRGMMFQLAKQQKKHKARPPSNKIVVIPQNQSAAAPAPARTNYEYSDSLNQLLNAINRK